MDSDPDVRPSHLLEKLIAADSQPVSVQQQRVEMVGMLDVVGHRSGQKNRQVLESVVVSMPDSLSLAPVAIDARQLVDAQRGLQVHHVVLEACFHHLVMFVTFIGKAFPGVAAEPVQAECLDAGGVFVAVGDGHAPFAGDDVLGHVEGKTADVAERAGFAAADLGFDGMGAILNHMEPMAAGDGHEGIHCAWSACKMHRDNGPGFFGNFAFHIFRVHVHGLALAIDHDRPAACVDDGIGRCGKGHGRDDDLVSGFDPDRQHGQVQGRRAGVERQGVPHSLKGAEHFFKTLYFRTGADPAGAQCKEDFPDFFFLNQRASKDQKIFSGRHVE